jgi:hypothetical protein
MLKKNFQLRPRPKETWTRTSVRSDLNHITLRCGKAEPWVALETEAISGS